MDGLIANDQALSIQVRDGEVVMIGPRVAVALTPAAAAETARRLLVAASSHKEASEAAGQASQTASPDE